MPAGKLSAASHAQTEEKSPRLQLDSTVRIDIDSKCLRNRPHTAIFPVSGTWRRGIHCIVYDFDLMNCPEISNSCKQLHERLKAAIWSISIWKRPEIPFLPGSIRQNHWLWRAGALAAGNLSMICACHTHTHTSHESQHTEPTWIVHKPSLTYMEKWCDSPLDRRVAVILLLVHSSLFTLVSNVSLFARGVSSDKSPSEILQEPAGTACCCCIQNILHKASEQEWAVSDNGFPKDEWIEEGKPVWA